MSNHFFPDGWTHLANHKEIRREMIRILELQHNREAGLLGRSEDDRRCFQIAWSIIRALHDYGIESATPRSWWRK